jgi:hypothetical protein
LLGKKKLPLLGNFGMFDKNKKRRPGVTSPQTADLSSEVATLPESVPEVNTEESGSGPELKIPASALPPAPNSEPVKPLASVATGEQTPQNNIDSSSSETATQAAKSSGSNPAILKAAETGTANSQNNTNTDKKNNKKEAMFSPMVRFACLGVVLILAGYAFFKSQQKQLVPLKTNA